MALRLGGRRFIPIVEDVLPILANRLRRSDVLSTGTFLSHCLVEGDSLPLSKFINCGAYYAGRVKEQVLISTDVDESKSLVRNSLDRAFSHFRFLSNT